MEEWYNIANLLRESEKSLFEGTVGKKEGIDERLHPSAVSARIMKFVQPNSIQGVWEYLLNANKGESSTSRSQDSFALLMGHHVIANYEAAIAGRDRGNNFNANTNAIITTESYLSSIVKPLITLLTKEQYKYSTTSTGTGIGSGIDVLIQSFPVAGRLALVHQLGKEKENTKATQAFSPTLCLDLADLLLRSLRKNRSSYKEEETSSLLKVLVQGSLNIQGSGSGQGQSIQQQQQVLRRLLFRGSPDVQTARNIAQSLPNEICFIFPAAHELTGVWSAPGFASSGDVRRHEALTEALLVFLMRLRESLSQSQPQEDAAAHAASSVNATAALLGKVGPNGEHSLASALSSGIGEFLDCSDLRSRDAGLKIAKAFSAMMGLGNAFDDLDIEGNENKGKEKETTKMEQSESDSDSDSDSDLEAYDLTPVPLPTGSAAYLRTCLDILQAKSEQASGGGGPQAEKQESALLHIPRLINNCAVDARDLSPDLVRALLGMTNAYNIHDYDNLRKNAILKCIVNFPIQTVPVISKAIINNEVVLGTRVWAVSMLTAAAHEISQIPVPGAPTAQSQISASEDNKNNCDSINGTLGKTRIFRPKTLMVREKRKNTKYTKNEFGSHNGSIALMFLEPLLRIIYPGKGDSTSSSSSSSSSSGNNHNLEIGGGVNGGGMSVLTEMLSSLSVPSISLPASSSFSPSIISPLLTAAVNLDSAVDELDALLLSEAILSLASLARCAHNTQIQRVLIMHSLQATVTWQSNENLTVRRAALAGGALTLDSWRLLREESWHRQSFGVGNGGALATLADLAGRTNDSSRDRDLALCDPQLGPLLAKLVEKAIYSLDTEPDDLCRALRGDIGRTALALDKEESDEEREQRVGGF